MARPARAISWRHVAVASTSCHPAGAARVHAVRSMKQRGIASFFGGGKAENAPPKAKVASATPGKSAKIVSQQETAEVLKDVNSAGTKRAREVIKTRFSLDSARILLSFTHDQQMDVSHSKVAFVWCRTMCRAQQELLHHRQAMAN